MSDSLVLELQRNAADPHTDLPGVLRQALLVATKLDAQDFKEWIRSELNGYLHTDVPEYRRIRCQVKAKNAYSGQWVPFIISNPKMDEAMCIIELRDPIGGLMQALDTASNNDLIQPVNGPEHNLIVEFFPTAANMPIARVIGVTQVAGITDIIRTRIIEWSLQLEKAGILGEGLRFSARERQTAQTSPSIHIEYFQGVLGDNQGAITQYNTIKVKKGDLSSLREALTEAGLPATEADAALDAVRNDGVLTDPQNFGARVGRWLGELARKAATGMLDKGVEQVIEIATGALKTYYGQE